jgi:hypothetical protein
VSEDVVAAVRATLPGVEVVRLAGSDRTRTAARIAEHGYATGAFQGVEAILARGDAFPDALSAAAAAGSYRGPVLLTATARAAGGGTPAFLAETGCLVERVAAAGGNGAVAPAVLASLVGPCDGAIPDLRLLRRTAGGLRALLDYVAYLDDDRQPAGSLQYLLGPGADRGMSTHGPFSPREGFGALGVLFAPLALDLGGSVTGDAVAPDATLRLFADLDGDGLCGAGEPVHELSLDGSRDAGGRCS